MGSKSESYSHKATYGLVVLRLDLNTKSDVSDAPKFVFGEMKATQVVHTRVGTRGRLRCGNLKVSYFLREGKSENEKPIMCINESNAGSSNEEANEHIVRVILPIAERIANRYDAELVLPDWLQRGPKWD